MDEFSKKTGTKAMILAGDFNTRSALPGYRLLREGRITRAMVNSVKEKTNMEKLDSVSVHLDFCF